MTISLARSRRAIYLCSDDAWENPFMVHGTSNSVEHQNDRRSTAQVGA